MASKKIRVRRYHGVRGSEYHTKRAKERKRGSAIGKFRAKLRARRVV